MASFKHGETPTEEPFTRFLTPLQVAESIQSVLDATWQSLPQTGRTSDSLERSVLEELVRVENWWMNLSDRTAHRIVEASQNAFPMPAAQVEAAHRGDLTREQMFQGLPARELATAIFWAWLLQPKESRDPTRTITLVRRIIDRQLRNAEEDLAAFA